MRRIFNLVTLHLLVAHLFTLDWKSVIFDISVFVLEKITNIQVFQFPGIYIPHKVAASTQVPVADTTVRSQVAYNPL